jgi:transposase
MSLIQKGLPVFTAAAKTAMCERTARKYRKAGRLPRDLAREHDWRTRPDPFEGVWAEVQALLEGAPGLQSKTIFKEIQRLHPGRFPAGQLRTLQRRIRDWRALSGPEKEIFFTQEHAPGEVAQSDFTEMDSLGITIVGERFPHLLYHFVLPYSNWEYEDIACSESFEALMEGVQGALEELSAVPPEHRTDNLSAATHELVRSRGRGFNARYRDFLTHYGMKPTVNNPGKGHENGDVEKSHDLFKKAVHQRLLLRGGRDFVTEAEYREFLRTLRRERNLPRQGKLEEEIARMGPLPAHRTQAFREISVVVRRTSIVRISGVTYSVPSRLIGHRLVARLHSRRIELLYRGEVIERLERMRGRQHPRIDYRHMISSLVRKPGAFRRFVYREAFFPTLVFRRAYDALLEHNAGLADVEYLRILKLAATTMESTVEAAIASLLEEGKVPEFVLVERRAVPQATSCLELELAAPDLGLYDELLELEEACT